MAMSDVKPLLALSLHYLVLTLQYLISALEHVVRLVYRGRVLIQYYSDVVARSQVVFKLNAWGDRVAKYPWVRKGCNLVYHCAAVIVGSSYVDERGAFTARVLMENDAYRDRLLVQEIEDLVALCDALRLTIPQRKAYFQCFLRIDFMRRSSVSRAELLRYCNLRSTRLTSFLLPNAEEATHRETARNRWDIMQLMATCFSVCTADVVELVRHAVAEAIHPGETEANENGNEESIQEDTGNEEMIDHAGVGDHNQVVDGKLLSTPNICQQIDQCLAFFIGVADPVERGLQALLKELYDNERIAEHQKNDDLASSRVSFQDIHGVASIFDVVRLFPVLVFPCIWVQHVLRTRVLGVKTWESLQQRRMQLQPHLPIRGIFLSVAGIVAASQVQLQHKTNHDYQILTPTSGEEDTSSTPSIALLDGDSRGRSDGSMSSKKSNPRKVVPSTGSGQVKSDDEASVYTVEESSNLRLTFDQCATSEEAWRVSANHALASVYIQCLLEDTAASSEALQVEFEQVANEIFTGEVSIEKSEQIRQRLVKLYGYRLAHSLLAKSTVKELNHASKTPLDERRAKQRYTKASRGSELVEDKVIYWKEFDDPVAKRTFYYNIRTGESRWEKPVNFVGKKKLRKRRKAKKTHDVQLQQKAQG